MMSSIHLYYNHSFSNLYNMDNVERLTQMYKNNISVYWSFQSFVAPFQLIKSPIYTMIFFMISPMCLYYNHCVLDQFRLELRTNMNTNAMKTVHLQLLNSTFQSFIASFGHIKSPKCTKLF
jgi:hypothetical protein